MAGPKIGVVSDTVVTTRPLEIAKVNIVGFSERSGLEETVVKASLANLIDDPDVLAKLHPVFYPGIIGSEQSVTEWDSYGHAMRHVLNLYEETCCPPHLVAETLGGGGVAGLYRWTQKMTTDTRNRHEDKAEGCLQGRFYLPGGGSYVFKVTTGYLKPEAYAETDKVEVKWWPEGGMLEPPGSPGKPFRGLPMRHIPVKVMCD